MKVYKADANGQGDRRARAVWVRVNPAPGNGISGLRVEHHPGVRPSLLRRARDELGGLRGPRGTGPSSDPPAQPYQAPEETWTRAVL